MCLTTAFTPQLFSPPTRGRRLRIMRVHVVQVAYTDEEPVAARVDRVAALVTEQRGADLVVLPEPWPHGGFSYSSRAQRAEPIDGPSMSAIAKAAAELGAVVHAGSIVERADGGPRGGGRPDTWGGVGAG